MITTVADVKTFLQISVSTYDTLIAKLIPAVESFVFEYCNNWFEISKDYIYNRSTALVFVSGTPPTITMEDGTFATDGFVAGMNIRVKNSLYNDGIYSLAIVAEETLTLGASDVLIDEDLGAESEITVVKYPKGLDLIIAKLIGEDLKNSSVTAGEKVVSESVGNHSISYGGSTVKGQYPDELLALLRPYKRVVKV